MDPIEKNANMSQDIFWYRGKNDLLKILLSGIKSCSEQAINAILLVGPGYDARQLELVGLYGELDVIDINKLVIDMIDCKLVGKKICNDFLQYSAGKKYDLIILLDVMEHIKNEELCFKKIHDLLEKNGVVLLTVPAYNFLFCNYDIQLMHYRRYNKRMIKKNKYFAVVRIGYWNSLLFPAFAIERLYERIFNKEHTFKKLPSLLNKLFYRVISIENFIISKGVNPIFGLSLYCVLKHKSEV